MLLLALLLQSAAPASEPPPLPPLHGGPMEKECPVGGETYSVWVVGSYSTYGARPDGRPYSYVRFPFPIAECPSNKLVVFDEFSPEEVTKLQALIESAEYKALVAKESAYYRGSWLAARIGRSEGESLGLLLSAIWTVTPSWDSTPATEASREKFRSYQNEFVERAKRLSTETPPLERVWMQARATNALRQMGEFSAAEAMRRAAEASLASAPDMGWGSYLSELKIVIDRKDSSVEPLDMVPTNQRDLICTYGTIEGDFNKSVCAQPEVVNRVAELRKMREQAIQSAK